MKEESIGANIEVALAVITDSPLLNWAGTLSLVPVPGPVTKPPVANLALFTVFIAVAILANIAPTVVAIAAILAGKGTDCDCAIPAAKAFPVFIAISAKANVLDKIAKALLFSPNASKQKPSPP